MISTTIFFYFLYYIISDIVHTSDNHYQLVAGVPMFYMNGQKMFSGAQEPEVFERMFEIAASVGQGKNSSKQ